MALAEVYPLVSSRAVARPFTYEVPEDVGIGAVVSIRFGRSAARGVVVATGVEAPPGVKTAPIEGVLYELPPALVDLALWLADYYGSTPARALELVAPKLRARRGERRPTGAGMAGEAEPAQLTPPQQHAVARIVEAIDGAGGAPAARRAPPAAARRRSTSRPVPPRSSAGRARSCSCPRSR